MPDREWVGCDGPRCPARAVVHALILGRPLSYCSHHANEYMARLEKIADLIEDDRENMTLDAYSGNGDE